MPLKIASWLLAIAAVVCALLACYHWQNKIVIYPITLRDIGVLVLVMIAVSIAVYALGKTLMRVARLRDTITRIVLCAVLSLVGWAIATLHLLVFDRMFLKQASIETFKTK